MSGSVSGIENSRVNLAYLPQAADIDRSFPIDLFDLAAMGLWRRCGAFGAYTHADKNQIRDAISAIGLSGFETRRISTLSGGQMQRALFARLLLQDAPVILLDEPFAAVDTRTVDALLALIANWHAEGRTVVAVLHDIDLVRAHFPQTLLMAREAVAWGDTRDVLSIENLSAARAMNEAFDPHARECEGAA